MIPPVSVSAGRRLWQYGPVLLGASAFAVSDVVTKVSLRDGADVLTTSLGRGIVGVMNFKKQGAARVRLRCRDQTWQLTLRTPDTRVGIEIYGRHPPGLREAFDHADDPYGEHYVVGSDDPGDAPTDDRKAPPGAEARQARRAVASLAAKL